MKPLFKIDNRANGRGSVQYAWQPVGDFFACVGQGGRVQVYDKHGVFESDFTLPGVGQALCLDWDADGEELAVAQAHSSTIALYNVFTKTTQTLETNLKDLTFMKWSRVSPILAVGNMKGNLLLYNRKTMKKVPVVGKHAKRISCGSWSADNTLALGSDDRQLTVSSSDGSTIEQAQLKHEPLDIQYASSKVGQSKKATTRRASDAGHKLETTISINLARQSLLLYNTDDPDRPIELVFQQSYGEIVRHQWFGDGYILIGFSTGVVVGISTHMSEIGEEVFMTKTQIQNLADVIYSPSSLKAAVCGDGCVQILDLSDLDKKNLVCNTIKLDNETGMIESVKWSKDGQLLLVGCRSGNLYAYLAQLNTLYDSYMSYVIYLSSLREITVHDVVNDQKIVTFPIELEPAFVAAGDGIVAVGMNNKVLFYGASAEQGNGQYMKLREQDYPSNVKLVRIRHGWVAVIMDGRLYVHRLNVNGQDLRSSRVATQEKTFSEADGSAVTDVALTKDFLCYCTASGYIRMYALSTFQRLSEYRHSFGITKLVPNASATRVLFVDSADTVTLFNPVETSVVQVPKDDNVAIKSLLWDQSDASVFTGLTADNKALTYVYTVHSMNGPQVSRVAETPVPANCHPVALSEGLLFAKSTREDQSPVVTVQLSSHTFLHADRTSAYDHQQAAFEQHLALRHWKQAWNLAVGLDQRQSWEQLGVMALDHLEFEICSRVYRAMGDAAMVLLLERLEHVDELAVLSGYALLIQGDYDGAEGRFLVSSEPQIALKMRRDLMHWERALALAQKLDQSQVPSLSRQYAQQLEFQGDFQKASEQYEIGLRPSAAMSDTEQKEHSQTCLAGLARCALRRGDIRRGIELVQKVEDKKVHVECAQILEGLNHSTEAADLFEAAGQHEKAAALYIAVKDLRAAARIMSHVQKRQLLRQFARAQEKAGDFQEAVAAFERAHDTENVVRILLEKLRNPQKAYALVRESKSPAAAALVAKFCFSRGDFRAAIEFLLLAGRRQQAFELAQEHDGIDIYAGAIGSDGTEEDYRAMGSHYETRKEFRKAAEFYERAKDQKRALELYIQMSIQSNEGGRDGPGEALESAITLVGRVRSDALTTVLIDYLMGERDGTPKDAQYVFKLYLALGNHTQAARTAMMIARQEQEEGQYDASHKWLVDTHLALLAKRTAVPMELRRQLMLVHSYILVKRLVKMSDHLGAARLLIRVANNISKFPKHIVQLLTTTVIKCQVAGLKQAAFEYASMLVRPEYRKDIHPDYKRKIEAIVRKQRGLTDPDPEDSSSPCPFCSFNVPSMQLDCPNCRNWIPYCIASGRHVTAVDLTTCPHCQFVGLYSSMATMLSVHPACPMCESSLTVTQLEKINPASASDVLRRALQGESENGSS